MWFYSYRAYLLLFLSPAEMSVPSVFHASPCAADQTHVKHTVSGKNRLVTPADDIEIFITAYEINCFYRKADQSIQSTSTAAGPNVFGTEIDRGLMREINWWFKKKKKKELVAPSCVEVLSLVSVQKWVQGPDKTSPPQLSYEP